MIENRKAKFETKYVNFIISLLHYYDIYANFGICSN